MKLLNLAMTLIAGGAIGNHSDVSENKEADSMYGIMFECKIEGINTALRKKDEHLLHRTGEIRAFNARTVWLGLGSSCMLFPSR